VVDDGLAGEKDLSMILRILAAMLMLVTIGLAASLGLAYIVNGYTPQVERGCFCLYVCTFGLFACWANNLFDYWS
jgi:hypothetical protein